MKTIQWLGTLLLLATLLTAQAKEEEVAIPQPWGTLRGTLVTPDEPANTAVLIIAGSGPIDRNGNGGPALHTNAYYQLAEALKSTGIASLRYDKQGIGASTYTDPNQRIPEDSLRFEERFLLAIPRTKSPAALTGEALIPYRRRIRLASPGEYRWCVTPVRSVRGVEAVGLRLSKSN